MQEFIEKVIKMRALQTRYFKGERDFQILRACKSAEKEVDAAIASFTQSGKIAPVSSKSNATQKSLFE